MFGLAKPSLHRRHHVETDRARLVDIDDFRVGQEEDWLSLLELSARPDDVVDVDLMSYIVDILDLIAIEGDLGVPKTLLLGYVADVEEETKSVVIFESLVYFGLCGEERKRIWIRTCDFGDVRKFQYFVTGNSLSARCATRFYCPKTSNFDDKRRVDFFKRCKLTRDISSLGLNNNLIIIMNLLGGGNITLARNGVERPRKLYGRLLCELSVLLLVCWNVVTFRRRRRFFFVEL